MLVRRALSLSDRTVCVVRPPGPGPVRVQRRRFTDAVLQSIQTGIESVHLATGTPWWASIAMSTIVVRSALFPLVRFQLLASRKLSQALPEVNFLFQLLRNRLRAIPAEQRAERKKVLLVFVKGVRACFTLHEVRLFELAFYPLANMAAFVSFVYAVRDLVINGPQSLGLDEGGAFWFQDLTNKDRSFALPFTALGLSYLALEVSLANAQGRLILILKDVVQSLLLCSAPFVASLPAGVFFYWIPSSCFGLLQSLALKNPRLVKLFRLPPITKKR